MQLRSLLMSDPILCLQRQFAKLVSRLLYSWSFLRNNNTAINLQMLTSSYGSVRFVACDQGPHWGFSQPDLFFSRPVCLGEITKNRVKVFGSHNFISNFNVFNNLKITLHYSVYMRTSGEKVRISGETERVQSVSYSHIRSLSGYIQWCVKRVRPGCVRTPSVWAGTWKPRWH